MKLNGSFILREVVGEYVLIPTGETALQFNGIISLNPVGATIWKGLTEGKDKNALLEAILEEFEVSKEDAAADLDEFLELLREKKMLA